VTTEPASVPEAVEASVVPAEAGTEPREPVFELHDVRYLYGGRQLALDGIDLRIERGERVALLGANGSGKSTLLKLLDGIVAPSSGTMRALGLDVAAVADGQDAFRFHREVGLVFQDPDIQLFSATVFDDVAFGPLQLGLSHDEVRACCDEALRQMDIVHLADRAPFELSGGEKKRAAIASVLSLRPDVLLLDEPTASLDPDTADWVRARLERYRRDRNATVLLASHNMTEVERLCERVIIMKRGRIEDDDTPQRLLARYGRRTLEEVFLDVARGRGELREAAQ
jgi:energy-coupling factor transporter ATP-binding protein EcfA2